MRKKKQSHLDLEDVKKLTIDIGAEVAEVKGYMLTMPDGSFNIMQRQGSDIDVDAIRDWFDNPAGSGPDDNLAMRLQAQNDLEGRDLTLGLGDGKAAQVIGYVLERKSGLDLLARKNHSVHIDEIRDWLEADNGLSSSSGRL